MLVIKRKSSQSVRIFVPPSDKPQAIEVQFFDVDRGYAKVGFQAAPEVRIVRGELKDEGDEGQ